MTVLPVGWVVILWACQNPELAVLGLAAVVAVCCGIGPRWWGRKIG